MNEDADGGGEGNGMCDLQRPKSMRTTAGNLGDSTEQSGILIRKEVRGVCLSYDVPACSRRCLLASEGASIFKGWGALKGFLLLPTLRHRCHNEVPSRQTLIGDDEDEAVMMAMVMMMIIIRRRVTRS